MDRAKLDELDEKMKEVENNPNLSPEEKQEQLAALQAEKDKIMEEAKRRTEEKQMANANNEQSFLFANRNTLLKNRVFY